MDTIMKDTGTLQGVSVKASNLLDLLTGAAIAAHSKSDLKSLNGVYIKSEGGKLTAFATDRYRLIVGELAGEGKGELSNSFIPLTDIKRIISTLKDLNKADLGREVITLTRAGDLMTVIACGSILTITIPGENCPPYEHLFTGEPAAISEIQLNADYLAAFAKVPSSGGGQLFTFTGEDTVSGKVRVKPIKVKINHDTINWRGLLMPMRTI